MFGFFKKKSKFEAYLDSGMSMVSFFYKCGIHASNDILLKENSANLIRSYEHIKPLYYTYNSFVIANKNEQDLTNPSNREKIVHFMMLATAFAYGLQNQRLDEDNLRDIIDANCSLLFEDSSSFLIKNSGAYNNIHRVMKQIAHDVDENSFFNL